jgi:predicted enzyme related to lactoylglutathione lyase
VFRATDSFASYSADDLPKAKAFYSGTLGLDVTEDQMGFLQVTLGNGGSLLIYGKDDHQPATFTVLNLVVEDLDVAIDELVAAGVKMEQYDLPGIKTDERGIARSDFSPPIAWFTDPAGNVIAVMSLPD